MMTNDSKSILDRISSSSTAMSDSYLSEDLAAWKHAVASRDSQVKDHFPELEPGFFDPETGQSFLKMCGVTF